ncbi:beta-ketoacyl synthase N-terminal-like domain-containing protein [Bacillus cereus]
MEKKEKTYSRRNEPVAIIGISGKLPKSNNLEEYWKHLYSEEDLISEIPIDRFDWKEYYGDPMKEPNKTNSRWGVHEGSRCV